MLKLKNYIQVRTTDVFFISVFKVGLLPYLILTITSMKRRTLIEHKKKVIICEENGPINLSCNVLLTTLKVNTIIKTCSTCCYS